MGGGLDIDLTVGSLGVPREEEAPLVCGADGPVEQLRGRVEHAQEQDDSGSGQVLVDEEPGERG